MATENLIARVEKTRDEEAAASTEAQKKYEAAVEAWNAEAEKVLAKLRKELDDSISKLTIENLRVKASWNYDEDGRTKKFFSSLSVGTPQVAIPDPPEKPTIRNPEEHEQVLRMLRATTQKEIAVSVNDNLYYYL